MSSENNEEKRSTLDNREHIIKLVNTFYDKVKTDDLIGPIFGHVDWNEHLPKLYNFWEDLLFGTDNYRGRPFPPHMKLNLKPEHFVRWLELFSATVDEYYVGMKAQEIKNRASRIAINFSANLGLV